MTTYARRLGRLSATVVVVAGAIALGPTGMFAQPVDHTRFGDWDMFGLTVARLYRLRAQGTGRARGAPSGAELLVPGYPWTPALFVAVAFLAVANLVLANARNAAIGAAFLLLGIPVYLWWSRPTLASVGSGEGGTL